MNAIIRLGNGKYYCSAIFGYYNDNQGAGNRYDMYYIVFDQEKTKLIKQPLFNSESSPILDKTVLIFDGDRTNWIMDENGYGGVDFLTKDRALQIVKNGIIPDELLSKCHQADSYAVLNEYNEIKTEKDIHNLMWLAGGFHDAYISKLEEKKDGSLLVLFEGVWGCSVEIYFADDVSYCIDSKDPEDYDIYWFGSTLMLKDEYKIFVDDDCVSLDEIDDSYCWFKAKEMKYRVIPD